MFRQLERFESQFARLGWRAEFRRRGVCGPLGAQLGLEAALPTFEPGGPAGAWSRLRDRIWGDPRSVGPPGRTAIRQTQFLQESTGGRKHALSTHVAAPGAGQQQPLAGAGHPDEHQPAFLLDFVGRLAAQTAVVGEQSLLHCRDEDHGKLQPLGRMQGHQRHFARRLIHTVEISYEAAVLEESQQRGIGGVFLIVLGRRVPQFLDICQALEIGFIMLVEPGGIPGLLEQFIEQGRNPGEGGLRQPVDDLHKPPEGQRGAPGESGKLVGLAGRLEGGDPLLIGPIEQAGDGGLANSPHGSVHHPLERQPVGGIGNQPEVGQQILDLGPLVKRQPGGHLVGDAVTSQREFDGTGEGIHPVENGEVGPVASLMLGDLPDQCGDPFGLEMLVIEEQRLDLVPLVIVGEEGLGLTPDVVGDQRIGRPADHLRAAVVHLEANDLGLGEVLFELQDVPQFGPPPAIDRLIGIPRDTQIAMLRSQHANNLILREVRVLILVHQDVTVPFTQVLADHLALRQQSAHMAQQVVKVDRIGPQQQVLVILVNAGRHLVEVVDLPSLTDFTGEFLGRLQAGLRTADSSQQLAGTEMGRVNVLLGEHLAHQRALISRVEDCEVGLQTHCRSIPPEQLRTESVEGAHPDAAPRHKPGDPLFHFPRRLVGEGEGENARGIHPRIHQAGDSACDHPGLARAGSGQNQQGAIAMLDRRQLGGIQIGTGRHAGTPFQKPADSAGISMILGGLRSVQPPGASESTKPRRDSWSRPAHRSGNLPPASDPQSSDRRCPRRPHGLQSARSSQPASGGRLKGKTSRGWARRR